MSYTLVNQPSGDLYKELEAPQTVRYSLTITGAAVLLSRRLEWPKGIWTDDEFLIPGVYSRDRKCDALRFKSAVPATPAQVSIEAVTAAEVANL